MLIVRIRNDETGDEGVASYTVRVDVTASTVELVPLATCRVEGHLRSTGWLELLKRAVQALEDRNE